MRKLALSLCVLASSVTISSQVLAQCVYGEKVSEIQRFTDGIENVHPVMRSAVLGTFLPQAERLLGINDPNCIQEQIWLRNFLTRGTLLKEFADYEVKSLRDTLREITKDR